jgi:hypothetical protein
MGVRPDELSRRISNLDIASLRRPSIATSENGPTYSVEELCRLRPNREDQNNHEAECEGIKTPPEVPAPPPSPHDNSASEGALADVDTNTDGPAEQAAKKKKKKKSGKSKSKKPTGFEGIYYLFVHVNDVNTLRIEFYTDAPITPGEFAEENDIYSRQVS